MLQKGNRIMWSVVVDYSEDKVKTFNCSTLEWAKEFAAKVAREGFVDSITENSINYVLPIDVEHIQIEKKDDFVLTLTEAGRAEGVAKPGYGENGS
jgi:hypothetical protein